MKEPTITMAWIAAGKILANDPKASVLCPVCKTEYLVVQDVPDLNSTKFERIMSCPNCGARNILLMNKKD
jgi:DNA-directed RNA polymerase subunit RPC12/RpoP